MTRKRAAAALLVAVLVMLIAASAAAQTGQTCGVTPNPLANVDYSDAAVRACVVSRCMTTLSIAPTLTTNGYCDGVATLESSVPCATLEKGYNAYYACLVRALNGTTMPGLGAFGTEAQKLFATPGFPYHLSPLSCYACNHFRLTVFPVLGSSCSNWTCASVSSQSPSAAAYGQPDEGYNYRLCSTGCITGIMMIPFVVLTCAIFFACGCCWPSPSLKTTYKAALQEEEAKNIQRSEDDDGPQYRAVFDYDIAHEPAPVRYQGRHPEVAEDRSPSEQVSAVRRHT
ncbi:hypothetical protein LSCM1_07025 [Leishmania martiniquensis]|uniref:Membrane-associated protein n=1 Tax=Leishmania martiniquensis TaxID=1580590 RepID=A0A836H356_9TRYP|nr:hypothetical protein LSCM1_07025 [Leishmania martiniquensis]